MLGISYAMLSACVGPAEGWPVAASVSSAGWLGTKRAGILVAIFMSLGVLLGSGVSFYISSATLDMGAIELVALISGIVAWASIATRTIPVSISQIVLSCGIGATLASGPISWPTILQILFWGVSPVVVFIMTPYVHGLIRAAMAKVTSMKGLDLALKMTVVLSLVLLSFWRGANLGGILIAMVAAGSSYLEYAALTAGIVFISCLVARDIPSTRVELTGYPDPSAYATRTLSSLVGVWIGMLLGVTSSFSQMLYCADLFFRLTVFTDRLYAPRRIMLSWVPAASSALLSFLFSAS